MLTQSPTTPERVPGLVEGMPLYWLQNQPASILAAQRAAMGAEWRRIPLAIRDRFTAPRRDQYFHINGFKFMAGAKDVMYDQFGLGVGRGPGDMQWSGLYQQTAVASRVTMYSAGCRTEYSNGAESLVHEFGHHLDYTWNALEYGNEDPRRFSQLGARADFKALWNESRPTIPAALYGATNAQEWFAELFKYQIIGDTSTFLKLAGGSQARANAIRALFTESFEMPPLTGYPAP